MAALVRGGRRRARMLPSMPKCGASSTWVGLFFASIWAAGCGSPPIRNVGCEGPPEVEAGLQAAGGLRDSCAFDEACWERALHDARRLRDRLPEELGAHRAYVLSRFRGMRGEYGASGQAVVDEYRQRLAKRPEDAGLLYLDALLTENRPERRERLRRAIAQDDEAPWPHYTLAVELAWRREPDARAEARQQAARFVAACPDRLPEIQRLAGALDDGELFERYRERFVSAFSPEQGRFTELATLWQQSFQFAKPDQHAALRSTIATEVAATEARVSAGDASWLRALEVGYRMTGDAAGTLRVEDLVLAQRPCDPQAMSIRGRRFREAHPKPARSSEEYDSWRQAQVARVDELLVSCPSSGLLRLWELDALADLDPVPADRFVAAGLKFAAARDVHAAPSNPARAAKRFLEKRVGLEEVAGLIEQDEKEMAFGQERARFFAEGEDELRTVRVEGELRSAGNLALRIELALREHHAGAAEELLKMLGTAADAAGSEASDEVQQRMVAATRADLWRLSAELAEAKGESGAALAAYGQALASAPPTAAIRDAAASAFERFYGNQRDLAAWMAGAERSREAALARIATQTQRSVPDFRLLDLDGREWKRADLSGRAVLLSFWATWCGPCVAEWPYLSKLAKRLRDDPRILVLAVNVDDSPGPVEPFVDKLGCDFPVLLGGRAAWDDWQLAAIPTNFVLDPAGAISNSDAGFDADGDRWVERMSARLLALAAGAAR